jgi:uncharacterized repeat protein (TIGR01451 family)
MNKGLKYKGQWGIVGIALFLTLSLIIASGSKPPCGEGDEICDQQWNLLEREESVSEHVTSNSQIIAADLNTQNIAEISFDFHNESASDEVQNIVTGNDTASIIRLSANNIDNDLLSYRIVSPPIHGNISGIGPNMIYSPDNDYFGNDSIIIAVDDGMGNERNITVSIDVLQVYHPPSVRIRSPQNGEIFTAYPDIGLAEIAVHATASGEGLTGIEFYNGLTPLVTDDNSDYFVPCAASDANCGATFIGQFYPGTYTLIAKATDSYDKTCTSLPVVITVNPSEPTVEITSPVNGEIFTSPASITIDADVTDSYAVNFVEFFANSKRIGRIENASPYTFEWNDVKPGVYNLMAKATDELGLSSISKSVLIIVVPVKPLSKSDLVLTMASSPDPAPAGGLMNYLLTVTNRGPDSATDVTVEDFLPPELAYISAKASQGEFDSEIWSIGGLTKYRSAKLVITVQTPPEAGPSQIANTAYVYGGELDPDNSNNHATTYTKLKAGDISPE